MSNEKIIVKKQDAQEFQIGDMLPIGITIVVLGIALAFGLQVVGDIRDDDATIGTVANCGLNSTGGTGGTLGYSNCGADYNATVDTITGVAKIPAKLPIIVSVVVAAIIIGILIRYLMVRT